MLMNFRARAVQMCAKKKKPAHLEKSCRLNIDFAKLGFDTTENEPSKVAKFHFCSY